MIVGEPCVVSPPEYPYVRLLGVPSAQSLGGRCEPPVGSSPSASDVTGAVANSVLPYRPHRPCQSVAGRCHLSGSQPLSSPGLLEPLTARAARLRTAPHSCRDCHIRNIWRASSLHLMRVSLARFRHMICCVYNGALSPVLSAHRARQCSGFRRVRLPGHIAGNLGDAC